MKNYWLKLRKQKEVIKVHVIYVSSSTPVNVNIKGKP